jgi:hypothetical protein
MTPLIVEKDFWVCWILKELFQLPGISDFLIFKKSVLQILMGEARRNGQRYLAHHAAGASNKTLARGLRQNAANVFWPTAGI